MSANTGDIGEPSTQCRRLSLLTFVGASFFATAAFVAASAQITAAAFASVEDSMLSALPGVRRHIGRPYRFDDRQDHNLAPRCF